MSCNLAAQEEEKEEEEKRESKEREEEENEKKRIEKETSDGGSCLARRERLVFPLPLPFFAREFVYIEHAYNAYNNNV